MNNAHFFPLPVVSVPAVNVVAEGLPLVETDAFAALVATVSDPATPLVASAPMPMPPMVTEMRSPPLAPTDDDHAGIALGNQPFTAAGMEPASPALFPMIAPAPVNLPEAMTDAPQPAPPQRVDGTDIRLASPFSPALFPMIAPAPVSLPEAMTDAPQPAPPQPTDGTAFDLVRPATVSRPLAITPEATPIPRPVHAVVTPQQTNLVSDHPQPSQAADAIPVLQQPQRPPKPLSFTPSAKIAPQEDDPVASKKAKPVPVDSLAEDHLAVPNQSAPLPVPPLPVPKADADADARAALIQPTESTAKPQPTRSNSAATIEPRDKPSDMPAMAVASAAESSVAAPMKPKETLPLVITPTPDTADTQPHAVSPVTHFLALSTPLWPRQGLDQILQQEGPLPTKVAFARGKGVPPPMAEAAAPGRPRNTPPIVPVFDGRVQIMTQADTAIVAATPQELIFRCRMEGPPPPLPAQTTIQPAGQADLSPPSMPAAVVQETTGLGIMEHHTPGSTTTSATEGRPDLAPSDSLAMSQPTLPGSPSVPPFLVLPPLDKAAPTQTLVQDIHPPSPNHQAATVLAQQLPSQPDHIELTLTPDDLGSLRFDMRRQGDDLFIVLSAERPETLDLMRRQLPDLMAELKQAGVQGGNLSFGTWSDRGQSSPQQGHAAFRMQAETETIAPQPTPMPRPSGKGLDLRL